MLKRFYGALQRDGLRVVLGRRIGRLIAMPIAGCFIALSPWVYVRLIKLSSPRIGHYSYDTELILNALKHEKKVKKTVTLFYTFPGKICNTQLHRMWKRIIFILPFPLLWAEVDKYLLTWSELHQNDEFKKYFIPGNDVDRWNFLKNNVTPQLSFTQFELNKGKKLLEKLGIPSGKKFICLLGRDSGYLSVHLPNADCSYHDYRDVNINTYCQAAKYLAEKGYYVVRMGKHVKEKFNINHPQIIDYANHSFHSDFLDMYLAAHCYFFISSSAGLDSIAKIFRRPLLLTNYPLSHYHIWQDAIFFIPKKMINIKNNRLLTFKESFDVFAASSLNHSVMKVCKEYGLSFIDNSPEEITEIVQEMLDYLNGAWVSDVNNDRLQQEIAKIFLDNPATVIGEPPQLNVPIDYEKLRFRIGKSFIKNPTINSCAFDNIKTL